MILPFSSLHWRFFSHWGAEALNVPPHFFSLSSFKNVSCLQLSLMNYLFTHQFFPHCCRSFAITIYCIFFPLYNPGVSFSPCYLCDPLFLLCSMLPLKQTSPWRFLLIFYLIEAYCKKLYCWAKVPVCHSEGNFANFKTSYILCSLSFYISNWAGVIRTLYIIRVLNTQSDSTFLHSIAYFFFQFKKLLKPRGKWKRQAETEGMWFISRMILVG